MKPDGPTHSTKYLRYLRKKGSPTLVPPTDPLYVQAREHILLCVERGMSGREIGELTNMAQSTVSQFINGHRGKARNYQPVKGMWRYNLQVLLSVKPEHDAANKAGAERPVLATRRRLQGLYYAGFTPIVMARITGHDERNIHILMTKPLKFILMGTELRVADMTRKLAQTTPEKAGVPGPSIKRARTIAIRRGYVSLACWDEDTISDPDAMPNWTGACGTSQGYNIHRREGQTPCTPCRKAHNAAVAHSKAFGGHQNRGKEREINYDRVIRLTEVDGKSAAEIAVIMGISKRSVVRIRSTMRDQKEQAHVN